MKITGPSALAFDGRQLDGHDKSYYKSGFSAPVGRLLREKIHLNIELLIMVTYWFCILKTVSWW